MTNNEQMIPGASYWVIPEPAPEAEWRDEWQPGQEWMHRLQPARLNGWHAAGDLLWNYVDVDGSPNWRVLWI